MEQLFNCLCVNAFTFFKKAIKEIRNEPKFSAVNFCIGVEILLKARLLYSDIDSIFCKKVDFTRINDIDYQFKTIGIEEVITKIKKEQDFDRKIIALCDKITTLKNDRNAIVHFFSKKHLQEKRSLMAAEQFGIWCILKSLLKGIWKGIFIEYIKDINDITYRISKYDEYFQQSYETLKSIIDNDILTGISYRACNGCENLSAKYNRNVIYNKKSYFIYTCMVCGCDNEYCPDYHFSIPCPFCGETFQKNILGQDIPVAVDSDEIYAKVGAGIVHLTSLAEDYCIHCQNKITTKLIIQKCQTLYENNSNEDESCAYCTICQYEEPSVFRIGNEWICTVCFQQGLAAMTCPHCEKFVYGYSNVIKHYACSFCENTIER